MTIRKKYLNWLVILFLSVVIAVVFQQIFTSMTEQGIASGGPYDNAAAYPKLIAILIGVLIALQFVLSQFRSAENESDEIFVNIADLRRPAVLLLIFAVYLTLLGILGYHLTTTPMIVSVMILCGMRFSWTTVGAALVISFVLAYAFEVYLKVVLPGGIFGLNIPW
ncbi:MAG: tripartite tricarboxylate transporter TctB family protein [Pseudomonadota bacterium]